MQRRHPWLRGALPWAVALCFVLAELAGMAHLLCARHVLCPEHGVLEEFGGHDFHVEPGARASASQGQVAVPATGHPHEHIACGIVDRLPLEHWIPIHPARAPLREHSALVRGAESAPWRSADALYLLAPKHSPPGMRS